MLDPILVAVVLLSGAIALAAISRMINQPQTENNEGPPCFWSVALATVSCIGATVLAINQGYSPLTGAVVVLALVVGGIIISYWWIICTWRIPDTNSETASTRRQS